MDAERSAIDSTAVSTSKLAAGLRLGHARYQLKRMLGRSSASEVWLTWDREREQDIALKFLPLCLRYEQLRQELKQITDRTRQLCHPGIVPVLDLVWETEVVGVAEEAVPGWSLAALKIDRPQKRYTAEELRPWLRQLVSALDYAHGYAGTIHGHLTPNNLLLDPRDQLKVTDFSLAHRVRIALAEHGLVPSDANSFMSPQSAGGAPLAPTDDIYSLGAILYDLLSGAPPLFSAEEMAPSSELTALRINERLARLEIEDSVPAAWDETIAACLDNEPAKRPASVAEVLDRLEPRAGPKPLAAARKTSQLDTSSLLLDTAQESESRVNLAVPAPAAEGRSARKRGWLIVAAILVAVGVFAGLRWVLHRPGHAAPPPARQGPPGAE